MSVTRILLDILVVLVAAKLAAEGSERLGVPAVVGEIVAGVVVGPSALHLVGADDVLKVLGELGVILLLLDVGLEMDLGELAAVGRRRCRSPRSVSSYRSPPVGERRSAWGWRARRRSSSGPR
jgi:Kef-type K+ transport system membrane component KefB